MANNVDISGLKAFQKKLEKLQNKGLKDAEERLCQNLANRVIRIAVKNTPVETGHLKGSYRQSAVYPTENGCTVTVYNPVEYAPYVEYGHRTRSHKGWVNGRYMLTKATEQVGVKADKIIESEITKELAGLLS